MKIKIDLAKGITTAALAALPFLVAAQTTVIGLVNTFRGILGAIIPFFMILATVIFLWGVIQYITAGGEEEKIKSGRTYMLWGIIALFVMVAVWGLVNVLLSTFVNEAPIPTGVKIVPPPL